MLAGWALLTGGGCAEPAVPQPTSVMPCDPMTPRCPPDTRCIIDPPGPPRCRPRPPPARAGGGPCRPGECAPGAACVRTTETASVARCARVCDLSASDPCDSLGGDFECRAIGVAASRWGACVPLPRSCDPQAKAPCATHRACRPFRLPTGDWRFGCVDVGTVGAGEACAEGGHRCAAGLVCIEGRNDDARCRRVCRANADCPSPEQCAGAVETPSLRFCTP